VEVTKVSSFCLPVANDAVLEIASGFGEAISYFANSHRDVVFTPTDPQVPCIHRLRELAAAHRNMTPPLKLNIFSPSHWKKAEAEGPFDGILCFNLLHLIPWHGTGILLDQASRLLEEEKGFLAIYGPFLREGAFMSEPDRQFDQDIRSRDEEWGLRDLEEVTRWASEFNFKKEEVREMRAGNWMLILRRL